MQARFARCRNTAHHTIVVAHDQEELRLDLEVLLTQLGHRRQRRIGVGLARLLLGLVAHLAQRLEAVANPVGEDGSIGRIGGGPEGVAPRIDAVSFLDVAQRLAGREEDRLFARQALFGELAQR